MLSHDTAVFVALVDHFGEGRKHVVHIAIGADHASLRRVDQPSIRCLLLPCAQRVLNLIREPSQLVSDACASLPAGPSAALP
jgi:hypothetical protein